MIVLGLGQKSKNLTLPYKLSDGVQIKAGVPVENGINGINIFSGTDYSAFFGISGYMQLDKSINIVRKGIGIGAKVKTENTDLTGKQVFLDANGDFTDSNAEGNLKVEGAIFASDAEDGEYIDGTKLEEEGYKAVLIDLA